MRSLISISGERGIGILDGAYSCNILRRSSPLSRFWIWCFFPPSKDSIFSTFSRVWFTRVSSWVDYFLPHFSSFSLISVFCSSAAILLLSSSLFFAIHAGIDFDQCERDVDSTEICKPKKGFLERITENQKRSFEQSWSLQSWIDLVFQQQQRNDQKKSVLTKTPNPSDLEGRKWEKREDQPFRCLRRKIRVGSRSHLKLDAWWEKVETLKEGLRESSSAVNSNPINTQLRWWI